MVKKEKKKKSVVQCNNNNNISQPNHEGLSEQLTLATFLHYTVLFQILLCESMWVTEWRWLIMISGYLQRHYTSLIMWNTPSRTTKKILLMRMRHFVQYLSRFNSQILSLQLVLTICLISLMMSMWSVWLLQYVLTAGSDLNVNRIFT